MFGGIAQLIAGVIQFRTGNTFTGVLFSTFGAFWLSLYAIAEFFLKDIPLTQVGHALGLFLYAFGIFAAWLWLASFRTNVVVVCPWPAGGHILRAGAGNYSGNGLTIEWGGYMGLVVASSPPTSPAPSSARLRTSARCSPSGHWPSTDLAAELLNGVTLWVATRKRSTGAWPIPKDSGVRRPRTSTGTPHPPRCSMPRIRRSTAGSPMA